MTETLATLELWSRVTVGTVLLGVTACTLLGYSLRNTSPAQPNLTESQRCTLLSFECLTANARGGRSSGDSASCRKHRLLCEPPEPPESHAGANDDEQLTQAAESSSTDKIPTPEITIVETETSPPSEPPTSDGMMGHEEL
ncbi:hypothetical protein BCR39DRAFT_558500 [Naematelia encephala]|uniref:Uncharacterized protein n=1 Tax=Naematelia encephala TaxID=71784 RepID=A0A1Y2B7J9_9TREE|nr:hypothetical protein BCR39DRAFT_558500 [Naematelia encephala]